MTETTIRASHQPQEPSMPHLALGSHSVFYEISGHGQQDLLLFNGITMSTPAWGLMMPALERQYRVIRFDFLGQGQTDKPVADKYTLAAG
jgi:3-oxoadipate enol-lactonase